MQSFRKACLHRLPRFLSSKGPIFTALFGVHLTPEATAGHGHAAYFKIQPSRDSKYNMPSQDITAVSQQEMQIVVDQTKLVVTGSDAAIKASTNAEKKSRKKKKATSAEKNENGAHIQITVKKVKTKITKKQKKAAKELVESTQTSNSAKVTGETAPKGIKRKDAKDKVAVPSAASGGVPEPTRQYLTQVRRLPSRLLQPRRILIVMDLNGTLLFRPVQRRPTHFVERPHARVFMDYLLSTFTVAVWSSARPENVNNMVAALLTLEQRQQCQVIWGRDKLGLSRADYDSRVQCYKRLTRIWSDETIMRAHPDAATGGRWDQSNTVLVDDSSEKARSEPHNLLQIPEYGEAGKEMPFVLPQVHDYINELAYQADVSQYIRVNPFRLDPDYQL